MIVQNNSEQREAQRVAELIALFDETFYAQYNTRLIRGNEEPVYLPASETVDYHQIVFAHGYFASALHEVAHWCIAGPARRLQEDYGYWYCPDGRNSEQQAAFEQVEIKPQALEWAFSLASKQSFRVSTDNLNGAEPDREQFTRNVRTQLQTYLETGFPPRAEMFIKALHSHFNTPPVATQLAGEAA